MRLVRILSTVIFVSLFSCFIAGAAEPCLFKFNLKKGSVYKYDISVNLAAKNGEKTTPMMSFQLPTHLEVAGVKDGVANIFVKTNLKHATPTSRELFISQSGKVTRKDGSKANSPIPRLWPKTAVKPGDKWNMKAGKLAQLSQLMGYSAVNIECTFKSIANVNGKKIAVLDLNLQEGTEKSKIGNGTLKIDMNDGMVHSLDLKCSDVKKVSNAAGKEATLKITKLS